MCTDVHDQRRDHEFGVEGTKVGVSLYGVLKEALNKCKKKGNTGSHYVNMLYCTIRPAGQITGDSPTQNNEESSIIR